MSTPVPEYRELYSISDLHFGGIAPNGQIFCQAPRLNKFIERLAAAQGPLALVIAGDLFDSLPYLTAGTYIAVDGAASILQQVMDDASFRPVFEGLQTFLDRDQHELVVLIGNHDLEIAFPHVQEQLLKVIAPTDAARGRVRFSTSGAGFRCKVGSRVVYVTHGNEADPWNHVDHEALRRAAHAHELGQRFNARDWVPNAGTKLVIDVMNRVKQTHPFIDLLKPETKAAINVLSVLAPKELGALFDALPAFMEAAWAHAGPRVVLGEGRRAVLAEPEAVRLLSEASRGVGPSDMPRQTAVLDRVARLQDSGRNPVDLVSDDVSTLGRGRYYWGRLMGQTEAQSLRTALQDWIKDDQSFKVQSPDSTFHDILSQIGPSIDVVITGHTHLPRWIESNEPKLVYLNAGAWARTIGFRKAFLSDDEMFKPIYRALSGGSMSALDDAHAVLDGAKMNLVLDATLAAHVAAPDLVELVRVTGGAGGIVERPVDPTQSVLEWP
jgi:UDP-2,3-diacylglucosamine pyrophosphatase LpxH